MSKKLVWDAVGDKRYERGVSKGVLFPTKTDGSYDAGVAWNGLTNVNESPDGGEATDMWADNIKYGTLRSVENHKGSIEAYTYPDKFAECDGNAEPVPGLRLGQQTRKPFGLSYRTEIGSDSNPELGYKIHLVYGATASPSEKTHETVNDSSDISPISWDYETVPVAVDGYKPVAHLEIDSTKVDPTKLAQLEAKLYGSETEDPKLPMPAEVISMLTTGAGA